MRGHERGGECDEKCKETITRLEKKYLKKRKKEKHLSSNGTEYESNDCINLLVIVAQSGIPNFQFSFRNYERNRP